jgi:hypothetical protein
MNLNPLEWLAAILAYLVVDTDEGTERSLFDGSEWIGDLNHRTNRMDCGMDAGGFYEDDL